LIRLLVLRDDFILFYIELTFSIKKKMARFERNLNMIGPDDWAGPEVGRPVLEDEFERLMQIPSRSSSKKVFACKGGTVHTQNPEKMQETQDTRDIKDMQDAAPVPPNSPVLKVVVKKAKEAVMRKIEAFKVKGVNYIECVNDGKNGDKVAAWPPPSSPPFTTWSGLMLCAPDSAFAPRLLNKCGGIMIMEDGKEASDEEKEAKKAPAILGFWTAPEHWPSMLLAKDGIEDPLPCSSKDYPKLSFLPSWA
jgi:hypothetical protein